MADFIQIGVQPAKPAIPRVARPGAAVLWLQGVTLAWMLVEFGVAAYAAATARSPALLAFGSDSLVELLSATVVLLQWVPKLAIPERVASRANGVLLFALAGVVAAIAFASFALHVRPEASIAGMAITAAALVAMPVLAGLKRREARRSGNAALAADAVQSESTLQGTPWRKAFQNWCSVCASIALVALVGLAVNAAFHIAWFDAMAALVAIPFLIKEGRSAWQGRACGCC